MKWWRNRSKRRRRSFDPFASQPQSPKRRPGNFNAHTDASLDPNTRFLGDQIGGGGGGDGGGGGA